jgi:hypothetical protein
MLVWWVSGLGCVAVGALMLLMGDGETARGQDRHPGTLQSLGDQDAGRSAAPPSPLRVPDIPVPPERSQATPRTPFGTPTPPNSLTPAPLLPFNPNRPLMPTPSTPPASAPPPGSGGGSSSGGRLGR